MDSLREGKCEPCRIGAPMASEKEIETYREQIPDWSIVQRDGVNSLVRTFKFPDFKTALVFTNRVGALAERENHHPEITLTWGKATIRWWTHKIGGLHRNDFIMAAKTDACKNAEGNETSTT